ncbi:hypothetical protein [Streptomyces luteireticuli]|uniref:hypothetical protein n=1 Tax=Streptomyces luteireticuli TaxID=173858 RepID=UPI003556FE8B
MNVLLGIPGIVPVWLLWYFAKNWPLAAIGWTGHEPTENDGWEPWLLVGVPPLVLFVWVWWLANRPLQRRTALAPRLYWPLSALVTLVPWLTLVIGL